MKEIYSSSNDSDNQSNNEGVREQRSHRNRETSEAREQRHLRFTSRSEIPEHPTTQALLSSQEYGRNIFERYFAPPPRSERPGIIAPPSSPVVEPRGHDYGTVAPPSSP